MKIFTLLFFTLLTLSAIAQTDSCFMINTIIHQESCVSANDGYIRTYAGPIETFSYAWSNGVVGSPYINMLSPGQYTVTITDSTGCTTIFPYENDSITTQYIPDLGDDILSIPIVVNQFATDDILSANDQIEVCLNMEHSWVRDLEIRLVSPNGQSIRLHNFPEASGGEVHMGEPIDGDGEVPTPGLGYTYCWRDNANFPTILDFLQKNFNVLPGGTYTSYDALSSLAGSPKNGIWTIEIEDNWNNDNGFVFDWSISLNGGDMRYLSIVASNKNCADCEDYYCATPIRDIIAQHVYPGATTYFTLSKGLWNNRTTFKTVISTDGENPTKESYYDCDGNLLQETTIDGQQYITSPSPAIIANFQLEEDIYSYQSDLGTIITLPDCEKVLTIDSIQTKHIECYGEATGELCAFASGGLATYRYDWTAPNGNTIQSQCIDGLEAGVYTLNITDNNGTQITQDVTIIQPDQLNIDIEIQTDDEGNCQPFINIIGGTPPYTFTSIIDTLQQMVHISASDFYGCSSSESSSCILDNTNQLHTLQYFAIGPNPSDGYFNIMATFKQIEKGQINVYSTLGQIIHTINFQDKNIDQFINISYLPKGIYWVEIQTTKGSINKQITIQ